LLLLPRQIEENQKRGPDSFLEPAFVIGTTGTNWADPTHSLAGNMTSFPKPTDPANSFGGTYDAWNRLVAVTDGQNTVATYVFDGQGRRIRKTIGNDAYDHYYNTGHQLLEVRKNADTDPLEQYVWGLDYIDSAVLRFRDSDSNGTLDETLYVLHDANFNVTAVIDTSGDAQERYTYTPYGMRTILDGRWGARGSSSYDWTVGHQGLVHDGESGLVYNRARMLHPGLGRFVQRDPLGYSDGVGLYMYVSDSAPNRVDPTGTFGLQDCKDALSDLLSDLLGNELRKPMRFPGKSDKFYHCYHSCSLAAGCGPYLSLFLGALREALQQFGDREGSLDDMISNLDGLECAKTTCKGVHYTNTCYKCCEGLGY
jgi:RHS repeat-associated protein